MRLPQDATSCGTAGCGLVKSHQPGSICQRESVLKPILT